MKVNNKRFAKTICVVACATTLVSSFAAYKSETEVHAQNKPLAKNVIMLIPDGMSIEATTAARWYNGGQALAMDSICKGTIKTNWANGPITDSAPGGTAYSTGNKTDDGHVATSTKATGEKPYATVLEAAKLQGKATGIVATCEFTHATPADYTAHVASRKDYNSIMKQQIYNGLDVMLAGGTDLLSPDKLKNQRNETTDLTSVIKEKGYDYITTKDQMLASNSNKLWGMFAPMDLQYDLDRETKPEEPSVEEMTKKAIDVLSKDQDGFFLMVEGSKIDWAAHANDPAGTVGDIVAFDKAVKAALDFAKNDGNTVVVVASDHGTGGISVGNANLNANYSKATFDQTVNKLKGFNASVEGTASSLVGKTDVEIIAKVQKNFGVSDLTAEEIAAIKLGKENGINSLANIVSKRAGIGWTTTGHVGGNVALYAYQPAGIDKLKGTIDNTDVAKYLEGILGVNLNDITNKLFVNAKTAFEGKVATYSIDTAIDPSNPVITVEKGNDRLKLYVNTNRAELIKKDTNATTQTALEGIIVYSGNNAYVSQQAVDLIK